MQQLTVKKALSLGILTKSKVLGGAKGLDNIIEHINIIDAPDIASWSHGNEFMITNGFVFQTLSAYERLKLVKELYEKNCAAIGIKEKRYYCSIDQEIIDFCDKAGFPLIILPGSCNFQEIIDLVVGEINMRKYNAFKNFEKTRRTIFEAILASPSLKSLLFILYDLIKKPIVLLDKNFQLIDYAIGDFASLKNIAQLEQFALRFLKADPNFKIRANRSFMQSFSLDGKNHYRYLQTIKDSKSILGYLSIWYDKNNLSTFCQFVIEHISELIALLQTLRSPVETPELSSITTYLKSLLSEQINAQEIEAKSEFYNLYFNHGFRVFVVQLLETDDAGNSSGKNIESVLIDNKITLDKIAALLNYQKYKFKLETLIHENSFVVFITGEQKLINETYIYNIGTSFYEELQKSVPSTINIFMGVSLFHNSAHEVPAGYKEALQALRLGHHLFPQNRFFYFKLPDDSSNKLLKQGIGALDQLKLNLLFVYDELHNTQLVDTLTEFYKQNGNKLKTAQQLHIHRNTLYYRLNKIETILGFNLSSFENQYQIEVALKTINMVTSASSLAPQ